MSASLSAPLRLDFAGAKGGRTPHLSVDGMTPAGPNLSHWPGNRTPAKWRADLSTGIALKFARADEAERRSFLGDAAWVVNDHYDTDGFGSLLAVLQPGVAFAHEELLLAAAAAGDFGTWQTRRAFAIDRIVAHLAAPASPVGREFAQVTDPDELSLRRYRWLLDHADEVLRQPKTFDALFRDEMEQVHREIDAALAGEVDRQRHDSIGLSVVATRGALHRMTLNTVAGAFRVLHVARGSDGIRYRYHDRTESWFDLLTFHPLPRRDLRQLAAQLSDLEPPSDGASWNADPPTEPIPELYFGVPSAQEYGRITRDLRPSRLSHDRVASTIAAFFAAPPAP